MTTRKSKIESAEVQEVQDAFERWRSSKRHGREPIPPKLWKIAAVLCETYSVNRVARCLGLNHTALKSEVDNRRPTHRREASASAKPAFMECTLPAGTITGTSATEYVVELPDHRHGMPRIHVRGASAMEVAALIRALRNNGEAA